MQTKDSIDRLGQKKPRPSVVNRFLGRTFNELTVLRFSHRKNGIPVWECCCSCGNHKEVSGPNLRFSQVKSCGCLLTRQKSPELIKKRVEANRQSTLERAKTRMIGSIFGRLTVTEFSHSDPKSQQRYWLCDCICGNKKITSTNLLMHAKTLSCGCLHREDIGKRSTTHGMTNSPEYGSWSDMLTRCRNKKSKNFKAYGAIGRTVCERWQGKDGFKNFFEDMGLKPTPQHTIERKNNEKGYFPDNCCWASKLEQAQNTRNVTLLHFNGEALSQSEWERRTGIPQSTISRRLRYGWSVEDALTKPTDKRRGAKSGARAKAA